MSHLFRAWIFVALVGLCGLASVAAADPPVRTLGRVFEKLKAGRETAIGYFGGSITEAAGYRVKTLAWFRKTFPQAKVIEVNAAIGGTGSDLGAFRCGADLISKRPDLVFVEFNINDGSPRDEFHKATVEGIVRQLWASQSKPEIVFLYTTSRTLDHPRGSHPAVARHYGIPEIDLQPPLIAALNRPDLPKPSEKDLKNPNLDWKSPGQVFMSDSVHPNDLGHTIYTDTIVAYLKTQIDADPSPAPQLPEPLTGEEFARVRLVPPGEARLTGDWEVLPPAEKGRYLHGTINARQPGDWLEFEFEGTALGLFLNVQKDGGKFSWTIDDGKSLPGHPKHGGPLGQKHGTSDTAPGPYFPRTSYAMLTCGLSPGKHVLKIRILEEKDKTSTGHRLLIGYFMVAGARLPPWAGNRVGLSDEVLAPWTPVQTTANKVSVWGRVYGFDALPLPASVRTGGADLLAGPITLAGSVSGEKLVWSNGSCRLQASRPNVADLAARAETRALLCEGKIAVQYDGMIRCDLRLAPKSGKVTIDQLALEIPLRARHALFLHTWPGSWGAAANSVALGKEGYRGPFKPFVWLGDHARGLAWFSESDRDFFPDSSDHALEIRPAGDTVVWRVNLIAKPQAIDRPLDYTFGFQATPVKPALPDAWDYRIVHMGDYGIEERPYAEPATITYPAAGQWNLKQGTFECWVRPAFDPQPNVKADDPSRGSLNRNLLDVDLPGGHVGFYWNVDDRGMRVYYKQGESHPLVFGSHADWRAGQWHHVAFTWGDASRIFLDGKKVAEQKFTGSISGDSGQGRIVLGQPPCDMEIDEVRVSSVPREEFDLSKPPEADAATLLLDRLDESFAPNGSRTTRPEKGTGGVVQGGTFAEGRFGRGFALRDRSGKKYTLLDALAAAGVRTICFHEHWTDIQNYPRTTRGEALHKLVRACHERNIQLLVYFGYLMSDIAPEWNRCHEECLVAPRTGDYKRNPPQTAYMVCYKSHWQDFLAQGIDRLLDEYKIDGVYLDGTSEPWGCQNRLHGCGYVKPDGKIGTTYSFFATRQMMRRIYTIVKHRNPQGQVNVHQSTCMTIPTLAFATSYWDGEQLQGVKRSGSPIAVLPLDAFCAEFMGHNWGVPAELLWYDGGPFLRGEAVGLGLLHDIPTRPGSMADVKISSRLWRTRDAFGCRDATWIPYWESGKLARVTPPGVKVSLHNRPGKGVLAAILNTAGEKCRAEVALDLAALGQPAGLAATDVLSDRRIALADGKLAVPLGPMEYAVIWLKTP